MASRTGIEVKNAQKVLSEVAGQLNVQKDMALYRYWLLHTLLAPIERGELDRFGITEQNVSGKRVMDMDMLVKESEILRKSDHRGEIKEAWGNAQSRCLVLSGVNKVIGYLSQRLDSSSGDVRLSATDNTVIFERGDNDAEHGLYVRQEVEYKKGDSVRLKFTTSKRNGLDLRLGWGSRGNWINTYCFINEPGDLPRYTEISQIGDLHERAWESVASGYYFAIVSSFGWGEDRWAGELTNTACGGNPFGVAVPWANPVS